MWCFQQEKCFTMQTYKEQLAIETLSRIICALMHPVLYSFTLTVKRHIILLIKGRVLAYLPSV
jgi:hypothetical protein